MARVEKIGRVSSETVKKGTGKDWDRWIAILEKAGAHGMSHGEIVSFVRRKYRLTSWWEQGVATGFEMHVGKKIAGRDQRGNYATVATKTLPRAPA